MVGAKRTQELAERVKYVMNASVKLVPDHVFGEPMKNPQERLDPRCLSAEPWIAKDWKSGHANRVPVVRVTTLGTPIYDRADQTAHHLQRSHFQPMIFRGDHIPAQCAYNDGQRISRENELNRKMIVKAVFRAAMQVHMEVCYREFYNGGQSWAQKCHGQRTWNEPIWINYHMTFAGYSRWPKPGEYLKPIQDARPILALDYWNFQELLAGVKTFADVEMKHITSNDLFGPVKAFHQVTGAGNMAIAAQIPIETNPARVNHDEHCLFVFIIQGIEQRCTLIEKCQSNDLAAQWLNKTNDRTDQTVPMSAT